MKTIYILMFILFCTKAKGQERINEAQPNITGSIKTLGEFAGWMKNDLGKWVSANKAIPNYDHTFSGVLRYCEQLIKIEWCKVEYDGKSYLCFSKFGIFQFEKWNKINTQYSCDFWLINDTTLNPSIFNTIGETQNISIPVTVNGSTMPSFSEVTWKQILIELKKVIKEKESDLDNIKEFEDFDFQYRISKSQNIQCIIGKSSGRCDVGDSELSNSYYETTLSNMKSFLTAIISNN
jgi:hypothetical protein